MNIPKALNNLSLENLGLRVFYIGVFFLPSATFIGILFLISASIIGSIIQKENYLKSIYGKLFFTFGILIFFSSILHRFFIHEEFKGILNPNSSLVGLGNWIPFIWIFWALQPYIYSKDRRKKFALILISGSVPIILCGFGQYFFNWNGPFEIFNGLIIWYQRSSNNGLTSIFNNKNFAGTWFNFIWPFCIALFFAKTSNYFKKIISTLFLISVSFSIILTYSRNAWGGLILSIPFVIGYQTFVWLLPLVIFITLTLMICVSPFFAGNIQDIVRDILPPKVWQEFTQFRIMNLPITRLELIGNGLEISFLRPLIGFGATSFAAIFQLSTGISRAHSHNLLLEIAISYGYPATIILLFTTTILLISSFKVIFLNSKKINYFERAWWISIFYFLLSQLVDAQYFEGKMSIIFWILLAGLKNIVVENHKTVDNSNYINN